MFSLATALYYLQIFFWILCAYLVGSIPTAYWLVKLRSGVDIRDYGSGNPGAANVFRTQGKWAGICTLILDFLKGYLPVQIGLIYFPECLTWIQQDEWSSRASIPLLVGLGAIFGHNWPIFLKFRGGKGVATSAGVFLALLPGPTGLALLSFSIVLLISRHVSIGSMAGALVLAIATWFWTSSVGLTIFTLFSAALILFNHRKNIQRLAHQQEPEVPFGRQT